MTFGIRALVCFILVVRTIKSRAISSRLDLAGVRLNSIPPPQSVLDRVRQLPPPPPQPPPIPLVRGPTLATRMTTVEEKLDALAAQMKSMLQLMETFNRWHPDIDNFTTALSKDLKELTLRVEALEATPNNAPP